MYILILFSGVCTHADTTIGTALINKPTTWTKIRSPYVIEGTITVTALGSITAEAGTQIIFKNGSIFTQGGKVSLRGQPEDKIQIEIRGTSRRYMIQGAKVDISLEYINFDDDDRPLMQVWDQSKVSLKHFSYNASAASSGKWIVVYNKSNLIIDEVQLSNWQGTGIEIFDNSSLTITNSDIQNTFQGINLFLHARSTMIGNLFSGNNTVIQINSATADIRQNDFENNRIHINNSGPTLKAQDNWWGSTVAPKLFTSTTEATEADTGVLIGDIEHFPWSLERHRKSNLYCCSSVLFFPGLMGSRLYVKSLGLENQLWEPNRNADVKKLFLNAVGQSVLNGIYTKDIINKTNLALGLPLVDRSPYKNFSTFMDNLVKDKIITAWRTSPYDWRFAPDTLLQMNDIDLQNMIVDLAKKSKTKKVTLISHSNGGLLIKQLMIRLRQVQLEHLIDKIIFVALPEYGTPQAITSLLFGHEQSIGAGLILKTAIAKALGQNMPTAYSLLPSDRYFSNPELSIRVKDQILTTGSTLHTFLQAYSINSVLLGKAESLHDRLDNWTPPISVPVFQIVGTGLVTVSGLQKIDQDDFVPTYTNTGDGVVLDMFIKSANSFIRTGAVAAIDLRTEPAYKHMNIMGAPSVLKQINSLVRTNTFIDLNSALAMDIRRLPFSYKMAKVSASSSLLLKSLATTSAADVYDLYKNGNYGDFDMVTEPSNKSRYELLDKNILYINPTSIEKLNISQTNVRSSELVDIDTFEQDGESLTQYHYDNVPLEVHASVIVAGASLALQIDKETKFVIDPDKKTVFDNTGNSISQTNTATTSRDRQKEAAEVRTQMIRSIYSDYLRKRYLTRLDAYAATGDDLYLRDTRARIQRAIVSISTYDNNPTLKGRYAHLKADYQFLAYLFYYMSPTRPASMRFVYS
jgi:pimeloyl-ACP methyl ester carboxylesterase